MVIVVMAWWSWRTDVVSVVIYLCIFPLMTVLSRFATRDADRYPTPRTNTSHNARRSWRSVRNAVQRIRDDL